MITARVELPPGKPGDLDPTAALKSAMVEATELIANRARDNLSRHTKTGALRRSVTAEAVTVSGTSIQGAVGAGGAGAPYAEAVEYGTGVYSEAAGSTHQPIVILPVRAKALAWPGAGAARRLSGNLRTGARRAGVAMVFARRVVQQGQRPKPFLRPALEDSQGDVLAILQRWIDAALGLGA